MRRRDQQLQLNCNTSVTITAFHANLSSPVLLQGVHYLVENNLLEWRAESVAEFLYKEEGLNKTAIGNFLGERYSRHTHTQTSSVWKLLQHVNILNVLICVIVLWQGGDAPADTESLRRPARVLRSESGAGAEVRVTKILSHASVKHCSSFYL